MKINLKDYISKNYEILLKLIFYSYIAFIIIIFIPAYSGFYWVKLSNWETSTNFYGDIEQYINMANGNYDDVIAPYKFRVLIPFLWSILLPILPLKYSVLIWNFIFLLSSSLLIDRLLEFLDFSNIFRYLGVLFTNISFPILQVAYTPNLDIPFLFFSILFMLGVIKNNPWLIGISTVFGLLTKETIIFLFPVYFFYNFGLIKQTLIELIKEKNLWEKNSILSIIFLIFGFLLFLGIRGFVFNINYDYNIGLLEFPPYYERWLSFNSALRTLIYIFMTLTILWIAPIGYLIHRWRLDKWFFLCLYGLVIIFMITFLSARVTRVSFFLIIFYLPPFLRLLKDFQ